MVCTVLLYQRECISFIRSASRIGAGNEKMIPYRLISSVLRRSLQK